MVNMDTSIPLREASAFDSTGEESEFEPHPSIQSVGYSVRFRQTPLVDDDPCPRF